MLTCNKPYNIGSWLKKLQAYGYVLPTSYVVFDLETTGVRSWDSYIVQIGITFVENCEEIDGVELLLNWPCCQALPRDKFIISLDDIVEYMRGKSLPYKFSYEYLSKHGADPISVLKECQLMFEKHQDNGGYFLTHNGLAFDTMMLEKHFKRFLDNKFEFDHSKVLDTGLLEKGYRLNVLPEDNESLVDFFARVYRAWDKEPSRRPKWSLFDACVPEYQIAEKYNLNMSKAHTARFDCKVTHLLFEEYRKLLHDQ